jgi:hypothetical protein
MTEWLIWINYLVASALSLWCLSRIDIRRLTFADGLLVGTVYYLVLPMLFILIDRGISAQFILSDDYLPFRDLDTTLVIIICLYFIPVLHLFLPRPKPIALDTNGILSLNRLILIFVAVLYFVSTVGSFWLSGLWAGGHWHANAQEALANSGLALVLRHVASFARTAIFAILVYQVWTSAVSHRFFLAMGSVVVVCDLLLTFNRITAVYFLLSILMLNRNRRLVVSAVVVALIFVLPAISNMWPVFRGLATRNGYNLEGMIAAAEIAYRTVAAHPGLADFTSGVFESINIPVLNYIVQHQGDTLNVAPGSIYLRPATIFLPRMIWSDRPEVYGTILGASINIGSNGLALNSTLIGEPYGNFGAWWPIGILPMYFVYHLLFLQLSRVSPVFGAIGAFCAIAMWRFDSTVTAVALALCIILLFAVRTWISSHHRERGPADDAAISPNGSLR